MCSSIEPSMHVGALAGRYTPTLTITDLCDETTHSAVGVVSVS
jgi:hypothetical protein